jgi:hypothetical protein
VKDRRHGQQTIVPTTPDPLHKYIAEFIGTVERIAAQIRLYPRLDCYGSQRAVAQGR